MLIGALIVITITWSASNPNLMYFVATSVITLIILAFTLDANKRSNDKLNEKINKIIEKLGIEGIDELSKKNKDKSVSIEVTEKKVLV